VFGPNDDDTIAAIATPKGYGGVGVIRVSGPKVGEIAGFICGSLPEPRKATLRKFCTKDKKAIDSGVVIYFPGPNSFTGEDVLEFQGHGGPCILNAVLKLIVECGARLAEPGEFSKRAFINDKIDLAQAEAIADLIHAKTEQAAISASKSMLGAFSNQVNGIAKEILALRVYVEASIDFPDEDIELLAEGKIKLKLDGLIDLLQKLLKSAESGRILREGLTVAFLGQPNVGKSSLFNVLVGEDRAIVTEQPGTTRDVLREQIQVKGFPVTLLDTAGIRENTGLVEQEGILRAHKACEEVDHIFLVVDGTNDSLNVREQELCEKYKGKISVLINKSDLGVKVKADDNTFLMSAKKGDGIDELLGFIYSLVGTNDETPFISRQRHVLILQDCLQFLGKSRIALDDMALEFAAEELNYAHNKLGEITGKVSSDALLGEIFSSFCIGK
jgi:tRNA modification GTPase